MRHLDPHYLSRVIKVSIGELVAELETARAFEDNSASEELEILHQLMVFRIVESFIKYKSNDISFEYALGYISEDIEIYGTYGLTEEKAEEILSEFWRAI